MVLPTDVRNPYETVHADDIFGRLCASSRRHFTNPYEIVEWPDAIEAGQWYTSPELISIYGTPEWDALSDQQRKSLSFWEAVNFYSLNIHGEKSLMEGLARRLYEPDKRAIAPYLHHMLDEENKHSIYFGGFCERYAGKVYPDRKLTLSEDPAPAQDFLFFAKVMIFEEIVDRYNVLMARDTRLAPVARFINDNHHREETRHLAFGRRIVGALFRDGERSWPDGLVAEVRGYLHGYLIQTWREFYNPAVYADAGIPRPWELARTAYEAPASRGHRASLSGRCLNFLHKSGILLESPTL